MNSFALKMNKLKILMVREHLSSNNKIEILRLNSQCQSVAYISRQINQNYHIVYRFLQRHIATVVQQNDCFNEEYEVEQILDHGYRFVQDASPYGLHYLVLFVSYDSPHWISDRDLNCEINIKRYHLALLMATGNMQQQIF